MINQCGTSLISWPNSWTTPSSSAHEPTATTQPRPHRHPGLSPYQLSAFCISSLSQFPSRNISDIRLRLPRLLIASTFSGLAIPQALIVILCTLIFQFGRFVASCLCGEHNHFRAPRLFWVILLPCRMAPRSTWAIAPFVCRQRSSSILHMLPMPLGSQTSHIRVPCKGKPVLLGIGMVNRRSAICCLRISAFMRSERSTAKWRAYQQEGVVDFC